MEMFSIIVGGICVAYVVVTQILEWTHHMNVIKERWPRAYRTLLGPVTRLLFLAVAIALLVEVLRERKLESHKQDTPAPVATPTPAPQTGSATTSGANSPAVSGNGNSVTYGDPERKK